ncbi:MAG: SAM-dependent methyltransferase [Micromonosporaceae bacterium]|nr:SAM-dependent methyltransferase [Micromonosporaceae bacterium]
MYDYFLGGNRNFAADRAAAEQALAQMPDLAAVLRANRAFLGRVVRHMVASGIRQFLDLGSGIPTVGNVHEIAQREDPDIRVVYVDLDPVAVIVADELLEDNPNASMLQADVRYPDKILAHPTTTRLLDLSQPVGILTVALLHVFPDEEHPAGILDTLYDATVPGSQLALSHMSTPEGRSPSGLKDAQETYARSGNRLYPRSLADITTLIGRWSPLPPGLVACPLWRPDSTSAVLDPTVAFPGYAMLAVKER